MFYCEFCKISKNTFFTEDLWATASEFVTEMLIFTSSRSQMFFKISVLKNFAILEPLSNNKVAGLLLQNTDGGCFWIFVAANTFLQLNMVFIADSRSCFCSGLLWKHELSFKKQPLKLFCKKGVLIKFANFTGKRLYWSLFCGVADLYACNFIKMRLQRRCSLVKLLKFIGTPNLKSASDFFWNLFFHLDCPF